MVDSGAEIHIAERLHVRGHAHVVFTAQRQDAPQLVYPLSCVRERVIEMYSPFTLVSHDALRHKRVF